MVRAGPCGLLTNCFSPQNTQSLTHLCASLRTDGQTIFCRIRRRVQRQATYYGSSYCSSQGTNELASSGKAGKGRPSWEVVIGGAWVHLETTVPVLASFELGGIFRAFSTLAGMSKCSTSSSPSCAGRSGRKRPTPSASSGSSPAVPADLIADGFENTSACKKPRYQSSLSHDDNPSSAAIVSPLVPEKGAGAASSSGGIGIGDPGEDIPVGICSTDNRGGGPGPSNDDIDDDGKAAEVAATRLEAQIDDLTSDLGHWCLTDLRGWRRRRAAVAAAAAGTISLKKVDAGDDDMDTRSSMVGRSCSSPTKPISSPTKRSPSAAPCSPSEKEFLRQRRREARRSMLRGVATRSCTRNGGRKLDI